MELLEINGKILVSAKDVYRYLGMKRKYSEWVRSNFERAMLIEGKDFFPSEGISTGGRPSIDYLLTKEAAINIVVVSGGVNAKLVRAEIIKSFEQKQTGLLLNADEISALTDVVKAVTLVSNQKECVSKHYAFFNKPEKWWSYRANILGYSVESLKEKLTELNIAYKNQTQALIHIQPSEIIRTAVIDLLISLGRGVEYALNVAEFAKIIAEKNGYDRQIWDDTKPNPLGLNKHVIENRKKLPKI